MGREGSGTKKMIAFNRSTNLIERTFGNDALSTRGGHDFTFHLFTAEKGVSPRETSYSVTVLVYTFVATQLEDTCCRP